MDDQIDLNDIFLSFMATHLYWFTVGFFLFLYIFLDDWMSKIIVDIQIYSHIIPSVRTLAMPKETFNTSCLFNNFGYNKLDIKRKT